MKNFVSITQGDIGGIGPEIILKLYKKEPKKFSQIFVIGSYEVFDFYNKHFKFSVPLSKYKNFEEIKNQNKNIESLKILHIQNIQKKDIQIGRASRISGLCSHSSIKMAVDLCLQKKISAMVTCPLAKESLHLADIKFNGHTALLANLTKTKNFKLILTNKKFSVIHTTMHIPLSEVPGRITFENIKKTILLGNEFVKKIGIKTPKIGVCGLNPHAGENGIIGKEEIDSITPAVKSLQDEGLDIIGPLPGDVIFQESIRSKLDLIIAHYHDQGHIPTKMIAFDSTVNITLGLPIIRTSVDHGTAFDIAGENMASTTNLKIAIEYAQLLIK